MYNQYSAGEASYAMDEFIAADKTLTQAQDEYENAAEAACSTIDDLENEREESQEEIKELEQSEADLTEKLEALTHGNTAVKCIEVLKAMLSASIAMTTFAEANITRLEKAYGLAKASTNDSTGVDSASSSENNSNESPGKTTT